MRAREIIGRMGCQSGDPQWVLEVERDPDNPQLLLWAGFSNPVREDGPCAKKGDPSFYSVAADAATPYGNPLVVQEPFYAVAVPSGVVYRKPRYDKDGKRSGWDSVDPSGLRITGIVIKDGDDFVLRSSFSGLRVFKKTMPPEISDDGTIDHGGRIWHLQSLRHPDRERFQSSRYAAVFGPVKPEAVEVMELFDY